MTEKLAVEIRNLCQRRSYGY